jgi:hypothetical protein
LEHPRDFLKFVDLRPHLPFKNLHLLLTLLESLTLVADYRLLLNNVQHVIYAELHRTETVFHSPLRVLKCTLLRVVHRIEVSCQFTVKNVLQVCSWRLQVLVENLSEGIFLAVE